MVPIDDLGGGTGEAFSISADGQVIVGKSTTGTDERAFRWTAATGMKNLTTLYSGRVGSGSYLQYANAVSGDGVHVVGYGTTGAGTATKRIARISAPLPPAAHQPGEREQSLLLVPTTTAALRALRPGPVVVKHGLSRHAHVSLNGQANVVR